MIVRIIKAGRDSFWYAQHIGECYDVKENIHFYESVRNANLFIDKDDCEVVKINNFEDKKKPVERTYLEKLYVITTPAHMVIKNCRTGTVMQPSLFNPDVEWEFNYLNKDGTVRDEWKSLDRKE